MTKEWSQIYLGWALCLDLAVAWLGGEQFRRLLLKTDNINTQILVEVSSRFPLERYSFETWSCMAFILIIWLLCRVSIIHSEGRALLTHTLLENTIPFA